MVVISSAGTRARWSTRRIALNGVVLETNMTVSKQSALRAARIVPRARPSGWKALTKAAPSTNGESRSSRFSRNKQRNAAQQNRQRQRRRNAGKPAGPRRRRQDRADNERQRDAQFQCGGQPLHGAVPVAVVVAERGGAHASSKPACAARRGAASS